MVAVLALVLALVLVLALGVAASAAPPAPQVALAPGRVVQGGWVSSRGGRRIASFQGIPYAAPPLGELRFKLAGPGALLDVLVFIHGGAYSQQSGAMFRPEYLLDRDVILVTFNYRLGPLGFLSTLDDIIPGNAGLKDQVQALRWVQRNIASFGGNPKNVLVFGESAGASSVELLMLSPLAKGLFQRAALASGSVLCPWAFAPAGEALHYAARLAEVLKCPAEPSGALRDCLLARTARDIMAVEYDLLEFGILPVGFFRPVVEAAGAAGAAGAFLTRHPGDLLASPSGRQSDVPLLIGVNSHEGGLWAVGIHENEDQLQTFNNEFDSIVPMIMNIRHLPEQLVEKSVRQMRTFYYGDESVSRATKLNTINFLSDSLFVWPIIRAMDLHVRLGKSPVHFYEFAHLSERSTSIAFGSDRADYGVCHSDDLQYFFPIGNDTEFSEEDVKVSETMVQLLTNFASNGNPANDFSWSEVVHPKAAEYLRIVSSSDLTMQQDYAKERIKFWKQLPKPLGEKSNSDDSKPNSGARTEMALTHWWVAWSSLTTLAMLSSYWSDGSYAL